MKIAITDTLKPTLQAYGDWLRRIPGETEIVTLSSPRGNLESLVGCDGIVLTGGGDIHPKFYGREDALSQTSGVDVSRDEFEFAVIKRSLDAGLPMVAVCRGMQAFNVAMGGTLIPDVQAAGYQSHRKESGASADPRHGVRIEAESILFEVLRSAAGEVNSSHHQAVDRPGRGLRVTAYAPDGVVEGMEWHEREGKPFLQLVQWHPERMEDFVNPLSGGLLDRFASEVRMSMEKKTKTKTTRLYEHT